MANLDIPFAMFAPKNVELEDNDPMVSLFQRYNMCLLSIPYATSMLFPTLNTLWVLSKELVTPICLVSRNLPCWVLGCLDTQTVCICCPCCSPCLLSNLLTAPTLSNTQTDVIIRSVLTIFDFLGRSILLTPQTLNLLYKAAYTRRAPVAAAQGTPTMTLLWLTL